MSEATAGHGERENPIVSSRHGKGLDGDGRHEAERRPDPHTPAKASGSSSDMATPTQTHSSLVSSNARSTILNRSGSSIEIVPVRRMGSNKRVAPKKEFASPAAAVLSNTPPTDPGQKDGVSGAGAGAGAGTGAGLRQARAFAGGSHPKRQDGEVGGAEDRLASSTKTGGVQIPGRSLRQARTSKSRSGMERNRQSYILDMSRWLETSGTDTESYDNLPPK